MTQHRSTGRGDFDQLAGGGGFVKPVAGRAPWTLVGVAEVHGGEGDALPVLPITSTAARQVDDSDSSAVTEMAPSLRSTWSRRSYRMCGVVSVIALKSPTIMPSASRMALVENVVSLLGIAVAVDDEPLIAAVVGPASLHDLPQTLLARWPGVRPHLLAGRPSAHGCFSTPSKGMYASL